MSLWRYGTSSWRWHNVVLLTHTRTRGRLRHLMDECRRTASELPLSGVGKPDWADDTDDGRVAAAVCVGCWSLQGKSEEESEEEAEEERPKKRKGGWRPTEDDFLNLDDMEKFVQEAEADAMARSDQEEGSDDQDDESGTHCPLACLRQRQRSCHPRGWQTCVSSSRERFRHGGVSLMVTCVNQPGKTAETV